MDIVGGIMAEINGGKFGEGLTVGAINEILIGQLSKLTKKDEKGKDVPLLSSEQMRWISALVGAGVSETVGGNAGQGGSIADSATRNNFYAHMLFKNELNDEIKEVVKDEALAEKIIGEIDAYLYGWDEEKPTTAGEQDAVKIIKEILNNNGIYGEQAEQITSYYQNTSDKILISIEKMPPMDPTQQIVVGGTVVALGGYLIYKINGIFYKVPLTATVGQEAIKFGSNTKSSTRLFNQMSQRGWTQDSVIQTVNSPYTTRVSVNMANNNPATVYYNKDGSHVIIDNITKEIIQISDKLKPWSPDKNIVNPYIPK